MADLDLRVDYKDDILDSSVNAKRKYNIIENEDGTKSLEDVSVYTQNGDSFGAADINKTNQAVLDLNSSLTGIKIKRTVRTVTSDQYAAFNLSKQDFENIIQVIPISNTPYGIMLSNITEPALYACRLYRTSDKPAIAPNVTIQIEIYSY